MPNLGDQYRKSVEMARMLGLPEPVRPMRRRQAMPPIPQQARQRARKVAQSRAGGTAALAERLWGKLKYGQASAGEGMIPYAQVPASIRDKIELKAPPVGWDPNTLEPDELALLNRLQTIGQGDREQMQVTPADVERQARQAAYNERQQKLAQLQEAERLAYEQRRNM